MEKKKKIILLRGRAIDAAIFKLAKALAEIGHNVSLVVWDRQDNIHKINHPKYKIIKFTLKAPYDSWFAILFQPFWFIYIFTYLLKNRTDIIHACNLDTLYAAIFVKMIRKHVKLFYTIYDFYANNLDYKDNFLSRLIFKLISFIEKFGIKFTDNLFLVDKCRYKNVRGVYINKLNIIYNSPPDLYDEYTSRNTKTNVKNKKKTIFYAGSLHKGRGLLYILKVVKKIKNVELLIAGDGPLRNIIEKIAKNNPNIKYLGYLDYNDVIKNEIDSDILFAFYDPNRRSSKLASPNKLFEAMMCKKPIIINSDIEAAKIVEKERCGIIIKYGEIKELMNAIKKLINKPKLRNLLGENGRKAYDKTYSWNKMKEILYQAYMEE